MAKNEIVAVDELYVVLGKDSEGNEGVAAGVDKTTGQSEPLIGSRRRVGRLLGLAQALADDSGRELQLVKFTSRGNLEKIVPTETGT